jgi:hypothetical protein
LLAGGFTGEESKWGELAVLVEKEYGLASEIIGYTTSCPGPWNVICPPRRACTNSAVCKPYSVSKGCLRKASCEGEGGVISRRPVVYMGCGVKVRIVGGGGGGGIAPGEGWEVMEVLDRVAL